MEDSEKKRKIVVALGENRPIDAHGGMCSDIPYFVEVDVNETIVTKRVVH